jgi:hypothetical protein
LLFLASIWLIGSQKVNTKELGHESD